MITIEKIYPTVHKVRCLLETKYDTHLNGKCIEASELIAKKLESKNISCHIVHGYFYYITENFQYHHFPHSWVELSIHKKDFVIDVTLTQFQYLLEETIPPIIIGKKPNFLTTIPIKDEYVPKKLLY